MLQPLRRCRGLTSCLPRYAFILSAGAVHTILLDLDRYVKEYCKRDCLPDDVKKGNEMPPRSSEQDPADTNTSVATTRNTVNVTSNKAVEKLDLGQRSSNTNIDKRTPATEAIPSTPSPRDLMLSRTTILDASKTEVLYTILRSNGSDQRMNDISLITVQGIGYIQLNKLDDQRVRVHPNLAKAFDLIRSKAGTTWHFDGFAGNQRWWNLDNQGAMSLVHNTQSGRTVELARLIHATLELKEANIDSKAAWNEVVLSAVAMRENKIREAVKNQHSTDSVKSFLASFARSSSR